MPRIGIVLAGGMSKGAYQIGCLNAITQHFGADAVKVVSASSIGTLSAYAFATNKLERLTEEWKAIDVQHWGRFFPHYCANPLLLEKIRGLVDENDTLFPHTYVTVWNYTDKKAEYVSLNQLTPKERKDYLCAAIAIPVFGRAVKLRGKLFFDGAFLDNVPVYPLLEKELDYIFCIYFEECNYFFENTMFDKKIIKLFHFPSQNRWDSFTLDPNRIDDMISYAYAYTAECIDQIFASDSKEAIYDAIAAHAKTVQQKKRYTVDVFLRNINKMTTRFSKKEIL